MFTYAIVWSLFPWSARKQLIILRNAPVNIFVKIKLELQLVAEGHWKHVM